MAEVRVTGLDDPSFGPVVVNCSGLGSRQLANDRDLRPIRGQHVIITNPGITDFFSEDTGTSLDPAAAEAILRRCTAAVPVMAGRT
ncbi:FAD-dependent oxidoreductase [Streptomyces sp. CBMA29]|uniref:FAD-dependent oxidoreductase n=1 Tax=Streptomyces sp. CBMA29 TaxID=1896314 RepID=UPI0016619F63|nr:FAD-dependent oxidoreductase [Streptomyces sp. CBMA29]MBD0739403.1 hypothetical protein [Streptomyces sp. CBMA29]